jgi:hypothetical protein
LAGIVAEFRNRRVATLEWWTGSTGGS